MAGIVKSAFASAFRDYQTDGVSGSGKQKPVKSEIRRVGALVERFAQIKVASAVVATQPASPTDGALYVLPSGKSGAQWGAMATGSIAMYETGIGWTEVVPDAGWRAYDAANDRNYQMRGGVWAVNDPVQAPATSVTDSHFAQFDGTTGRLVKGGIAPSTDATLAANSNAKVPVESAVKGYVDAGLAAKAPTVSPTFTGTPAAPTASAGTNTTQIATTAFVTNAVNSLLGANDAEVFKGLIDCSTNPNYPAADAGHTYRVSVAGKIGGASGLSVAAGDRLQCIVDSTASGTQAGVGANWWVLPAQADAVMGPASATVGNIPLFNATTGKLMSDSGKSHSNDNTLAGNSANLIPTQAAVKGYVDSKTAFTGMKVDFGTYSGAVPADIGGGQTPLSYVRVTGDNIDATAGGAAGYIMYFNVHARFGGSSMKGRRAAIYGFADLIATPSGNVDGYRDYVGGNFSFYSNVASAGTNPTTGSKDAGFGLGAQVYLDTGAVNYFAATHEFDTFTATGASVAYLSALSLVGCNAVRGSVLDSALWISATTTTGTFGGHIGWNNGITFTDINGAAPFHSGSTLINAYWTLGTPTVTNGIDFSGFVFSSYSLKMPSFNVSGGGVVTGASYVPTSSTVPSDGIYLPASNTIGFATSSTGRITIGNSSMSPVTTDAMALGTNSLRYSALKLAQTANINWNSGNLTIVGSTDFLTFGGASPPTVIFNTYVSFNATINFYNQGVFSFVTDTRSWQWQGLNASLGDKFRFVVGSVGDVIYVQNTGEWQFQFGLVSQHATKGFGYGTGAGGTVTQATDKTTAVTLNRVTGKITLANSALAAGGATAFTVNNSAVGAADIVLVKHVSGGTAGSYRVDSTAVASGSFQVTVENRSGGSLSEAIVLRFVVLRSTDS